MGADQTPRGRDIELPNESRTIDPRLPDAPRRQYQMDVRDLETPAKDPAGRRRQQLQKTRMDRYLTTRDRSLKGGR